MNLTMPTSTYFRSLAACAAIFAAVPIQAQQATTTGKPEMDKDSAVLRLQEFEVSEPRTSAQSMAPVESHLEAVQPESVINLQTIQNSIVPTADYALIANLAPSVTLSGVGNGPGLTESKATMRGFSDGQYNVTVDGIPFGDGNDFTHHTTSYFPAKLLGRVTVDRGPGTASTIGMATFGGTMALETKDPRTEASVVPTISYGSYNTTLDHIEFNTGIMPKANGGSLIASYQYMGSDGYRTFGTFSRNTYFFKYLQPVGQNTTISFMGEYNNIKFNNPNRTMSGQDIITLGRNFGQVKGIFTASTVAAGGDLNTINGDDYDRNYQIKHTDTEFIALNTNLGNGWNFNEKVYSFCYNNSSHESPQTTAGATVVNGKVVAGTDFGGQFKVNVVRSYGTTAALSHDDDHGSFKTGVWFDYQHGPRYNYYLDYNVAHAQAIGLVAMPGGYLDVNHSSANQGYAWNMHFYTRTWEPYMEYAWKPLPALTITPGVKYMWINRVIEAPVNQSKDPVPGPQFFGTTYGKTLPLATVNYRLMQNWSTYAQWAQGLLTPPLASYQINTPQLNQIKPQQTTNYQVGTVYKTNRFNADLDAYQLNYSYLPVSQNDPTVAKPGPGDIIYFDARGAYYYGVEAEGTYYVGSGLSVFANGSRNYATYKGSKRRVESVPQSTAGFGVIYDHKGFSSSLMQKYTGPYTTYSGTNNPDLPLPVGTLTAVQGGFSMYDLSLGYGQKLEHAGFLRSFKARLQISNLFDRNVAQLKSPKAVTGSPTVLNPLTSTYNLQTPRSYFFTVSGEF